MRTTYHVGAIPSTAINRVLDATSIAPKDGAPTRYPEPCGMPMWWLFFAVVFLVGLYTAMPANADEIVSALQRGEGDATVTPAEQPLSVKRLEWEHLQKVLMEHNGNISAAARALKMHRRTLQRKLAKRPVRE